MPQLDLLTLSIQVSVMFFYGWGLFIIILNLILPQYFILNHSKKMFWFYLNNLIIQIKFYVYLSYVHFIISFSFSVKGVLNEITVIRSIFENFSKYFLDFLKIKKNISLVLKMFFFQKTFSLSNHYKGYMLNFYFKKNLTYNFVQNYMLNFYNSFFITKRKKNKIIVKEITEFWTFEDIIYIKNENNLSEGKNALFIYNLTC